MNGHLHNNQTWKNTAQNEKQATTTTFFYDTPLPPPTILCYPPPARARCNTGDFFVNKRIYAAGGARRRTPYYTPQEQHDRKRAHSCSDIDKKCESLPHAIPKVDSETRSADRRASVPPLTVSREDSMRCVCVLYRGNAKLKTTTTAVTLLPSTTPTQPVRASLDKKKQNIPHPTRRARSSSSCCALSGGS